MKTKINLTDEEIELRYSNWLSMLIDMIQPKNLYLLGGRGLAKTEDILAKRTINIFEDFPGGIVSFIGDTYVNMIGNVLPNLVQGWKRQKFFEDIHFVIGKKPPDKWLRRQATKQFDHEKTMSIYNGCTALIRSLDRPTLSAGISSLHVIGDEGKSDNPIKLNKTIPTLRGDRNKFGHSPFFMGNTFVSDVANPFDGEYDWMNSKKEFMDSKRIFYVFQAALIINDIQIELYNARKNSKPQRIIDNIEKNLFYWKEKWRIARMNTTFFYIASSLVNIDILTFRYILDQRESLETFEEFKTAILSLSPSVSRGARFYPNLNDTHFYGDGYNYDYYDRFGVKDNIKQTSEGLKYVQHQKRLEAGLDAGNMMSLVIGQEQGDVYRVLKNMYTLVPEYTRELADKFIEFFAPHKFKVLDLYYDRSANNYRKAGKDLASQIKKEIEFDKNGKRTGWTVNLMSVGQANIFMQDEYDLMMAIMGGKNSKLPKLLIDKFECKELKSSLEGAQAKTIVDKRGRKQMQKVKTSEKKKLEDLPMGSTNMSDALKYLMWRRKWVNIIKNKLIS